MQMTKETGDDQPQPQNVEQQNSVENVQASNPLDALLDLVELAEDERDFRNVGQVGALLEQLEEARRIIVDEARTRGETPPRNRDIARRYADLKTWYESQIQPEQVGSALSTTTPIVPADATNASPGVETSHETVSENRDNDDEGSIDLGYDDEDKNEFESQCAELISFVNSFLESNDPPNSYWIEDVSKMKLELQKLSVGVRNRYASNTYFNAVFSKQLSRATETLEELFAYVENKDPMEMSWPELAKEIGFRGMDINVHAEVGEGSVVDKRRIVLYQAFMSRRGRQEGENYQDRTERIHWSTYIQLSKLEDVNQVEGEMPTCTRSALFEQMEKRQIERVDILLGLTYHPKYGSLIRKALRDLVEQIASNNPPIGYDQVTRGGRGRTKIKEYIEANYEDEIRNQVLADLNGLEKDRMTKHLIEVIWKLHFAFDLLTVSFADLQKNTKTIVHGTKKSGQEVKDLDWVFISRPDAGLVHRLFRYDTPSDWSANYLTFLSRIPHDYGRNNSDGSHPEERRKLVEIQKTLLMQAEALYGADSFSGENGIEPTDLFHPLFPDHFSFLTLAPGEIIEGNEGQYFTGGDLGEPLPVERPRMGGDSVNDRDLYQQAVKGWNYMLQTVLGDLPDPITREMILEKAPTEKSSIDLGLIDQLIKNGAGLAKVFPGEHLTRALAPFFTNYIIRIFARYDSSEEYRQATFKQVVEKLRESSNDKAGLYDYRDQIEDVIARISADPSRPGEEMSDSLRNGVYKRRKERKAYLDRIYIKEGKGNKIPKTGGFGTWIKSRGFDKIAATEEQVYWDIVSGKKPLPPSGVQRQVSLVRIDEK